MTKGRRKHIAKAATATKIRKVLGITKTFLQAALDAIAATGIRK